MTSSEEGVDCLAEDIMRFTGDADNSAEDAPQKPVTSVEDFYFLLQAKGGGSGPGPQGRAGLRAALLDLVKAYAEPQVQKEVAAVLLECESAQRRGIAAKCSEGDWVHCLRLLLTPLQMSVAADHGFASSPLGLQKMQNAVLRRICEGDREFRDLANRCLDLLCLPQVQKLTLEVSAEELLRSTETEDAMSAAWSSVQDLIHLLESHTGWDATRQVEKLRRLRERRRPVGDIGLGTLATWAAWEKFGLSVDFACRPPTSDRPSHGAVARLFRPSHDEVLQHVMENKPLVIAGVLNKDNFPPLEDFQDFEYLKARCGHRHVKVKGDPSFDRLGRKIFVNDPFVSLPMAEYLDMIEEAERSGETAPFYMGKVLLGEELPEMLEDIDASVASPWSLYRNAFGRIKDGVHTYFGCGRNTTTIHADPSENLLAVVSGRKTFQLFPPHDADCLYSTTKKPLNSCVPPFTRPGDMPPELRERFPKYEHASPMTVELSAGDILYLPIFWWHGVTGDQGRNMLLNWWSQMHPSKVVARPEREDEMTIREFVQSLNP